MSLLAVARLIVRLTPILCLAVCGMPAAAQPSFPPVPEGLIVERDIAYRQVKGETLKLDLVRPVEAEQNLPLIICIHGGGWSKGYRSALAPFLIHLAQNGYAAATISYRLSPKHKFPDHIEDVRASVRFLRAHAAQYNLDPQRFGAMGFSAGGHLAIMLGVMGPQDSPKGDEDNPGQPATVLAVVNYFGSVDFRTWRVTEEGDQRIRRQNNGLGFEQVLAGVFGGYDPTAPIMRDASPAHYLDADDSPILTFHGTEDLSVPFAQASEFDGKMKQAGATHHLYVMQGEGHGWSGEKLQKTMDAHLEFFNKHLKKTKQP